MEKIKKTILRALTTESVVCPSGTTGPCHKIIPDTGAIYYMKIGLIAETMDIGFFDAYVEPAAPPEPPIPPEPPVETYFLEDEYENVLTDENNEGFLYE